jgi:hypothetical protein
LASVEDNPADAKIDVEKLISEDLAKLIGQASGSQPASKSFVREDAWMGILAALFASVLVTFSLVHPLIPSGPSSKAPPSKPRTPDPDHTLSTIPPPADPRWPGAARTALMPILLLDDEGRPDGGYGLRAGFWRMHRLLAGRLAGRATVFATPAALRRCPAAAAAARDARWELGLLLPREWAGLAPDELGERCAPPPRAAHAGRPIGGW